MVITLHGQSGVHVQQSVAKEPLQGQEYVPIQNQPMVATTALLWAPTLKPRHAKCMIVLVSLKKRMNQPIKTGQ